MTHIPFPAYEFDPTLTTSELLRAQDKANKAKLSSLISEHYGLSDEDVQEAKNLFDGENFDDVEKFLAQRQAQRLEERRADVLRNERLIAKMETTISHNLDAFIESPTIELAKTIIGEIDFHSDIYKDEYHVRPHHMWSGFFKLFGETQNAIWEQAFNEMLKA